MLQTIREHTQGWIAGVIITIIILSFGLWGIHSYFVGGGKNNVVAEVNGVEITREQLSIAYERIRRQILAQYGNHNLFNQNENSLKDQALKALIEFEVLKQSAKEQGFKISNIQVNNYLQNISDFQVEGQFSPVRFQEILSSSMFSANEFMKLLQTSLLIDQPKFAILYTAYAFPESIKNAINLITQERDIEYMEIPLSYFLASVANIPSDQLRQYYLEHKKEFMLPEEAAVEYVQLTVKDLAKNINPLDSELKKFYTENVANFTLPKQWKIQTVSMPIVENASKEDTLKTEQKINDILKQVQSGKDFAEFVKTYPGDLPKDWFNIADVPKELKTLLLNLKSGEVSQPIKTKQRMYLIKLIDIKKPEVQAFDVVYEKVKQRYAMQKAEEQFAEKREQLASLSFEYPDSLQKVSQSLDLPIKISESFIKEKAGNDIAQYKQVREIAFSNDILILKNNSDVIQINPETVIVLRIKTHKPAAPIDFKTAAIAIEQKLKTKEADNRAEKIVEAMQNKLKQEQNPQLIAKENKLSWIKPGFISRYANKIDKAILDLAFRLPNPIIKNNKPQYGFIKTVNGYAIVSVKTVRIAAKNPKQDALFAEQIERSDGQLEYELYKQSQLTSAKIKANT